MAATTRQDDERLLHMLDRRDGDCVDMATISRELGMTRSSATAQMWRVDNAMDPKRVCEGTMPRRWWA